MTRAETIRRLMCDPRTHGVDADAGVIERRETHISWLFLTPEHVYKVKKPLDLGFLDFSTLERRRWFCHEEVRLNRRLSPSVYEAVVAIHGEPGRARLREDPTPDMNDPGTEDADTDDADTGNSDAGNAGDVLDYAVRMRRLPEDRWLVRLLETGEADRHLMHRLAHRLVGFHALAERGEEITRLGSLESVRRNADENFEQTAAFVGGTLDAAIRDAVRAWTEAFQEEREGVFRRRETEGRVRDGHGDLHCAQICVENGIDFIDCIEFNRRFRCADVAADLAFTSMDLRFHGHPALADALVLEYMARSGDVGLARVLDFYECYRAYTRGKVESMRHGQAVEDSAASADGHESGGRARRYFELAHRYARPRRAILLITCGPMASGKSTLAAALAERLGARVLRSDVVRKELAGLEPSESREDPWGEGLYARSMTDRTYEHLHERAARLLAAGQVVILDASYRQRARRRAALETAAAAGAAGLVLCARCDEATLRRRLARRASGSDVSDGRLELLDAQLQSWEAVDEVPSQDLVIVDTGAGAAEEGVVGALGAIYRRLLREDRGG